MATSHSILTLQIPPRCPKCNAVDRVRIETVAQGKVVTLLWRCGKCDHNWPVTS